MDERTADSLQFGNRTQRRDAAADVFNLVFGELVPKRIALQKSEAFCMLTVMPVHYISIILSPFIKLLSVSTKGVLRLLRMKTEDEEDAVTEEEILSMMKMGYERGTFDDSERRMVHSIFAFDDRSGTEIMVPRQRVTVLDIEEPLEEIIEEVLESRYSRIPVYEEEIDNIIGILHVKDVLLRMVRTTRLSRKRNCAVCFSGHILCRRRRTPMSFCAICRKTECAWLFSSMSTAVLRNRYAERSGGRDRGRSP